MKMVPPLVSTFEAYKITHILTFGPLIGIALPALPCHLYIRQPTFPGCAYVPVQVFETCCPLQQTSLFQDITKQSTAVLIGSFGIKIDFRAWS